MRVGVEFHLSVYVGSWAQTTRRSRNKLAFKATSAMYATHWMSGVEIWTLTGKKREKNPMHLFVCWVLLLLLLLFFFFHCEAGKMKPMHFFSVFYFIYLFVWCFTADRKKRPI